MTREELLSEILDNSRDVIAAVKASNEAVNESNASMLDVLEVVKRLSIADPADPAPEVQSARVGTPVPYLRYAKAWLVGNDSRIAQGIGPITQAALDALPTHCLYAQPNLPDHEQRLLDYNNDVVDKQSKPSFWFIVFMAQGKEEVFTKPCLDLQGFDIPATTFLVHFQRSMVNAAPPILEYEDMIRYAKAWVIAYISRKHTKDQKALDAGTGFTD